MPPLPEWIIFEKRKEKPGKRKEKAFFQLAWINQKKGNGINEGLCVRLCLCRSLFIDLCGGLCKPTNFAAIFYFYLQRISNLKFRLDIAPGILKGKEWGNR